MMAEYYDPILVALSFIVVLFALTALKARAALIARLRARTAELAATNRELQRALQGEEDARKEREETSLALREREEQLRQAQKMEAIGSLAGGIAHDFNNLLTVIRCNAELIADDVAPRSRRDLDELVRSVDRAASLTQQLLAYGRRQFMNPVNVSLNAIVNQLDIMMRRLIAENIEMRLELEPELGLVHVDQGRMEQVLTNLVLNSSLAMPHGGRLVIRTRNVESDETAPDGAPILIPRSIVLEVEDNGHGMSAEVLNRAFEPFFTTRPRGTGSGLGLAMVYGIIKQSGGEVTLDSELGRGTIARVILPCVGGPDNRAVTTVDDQAFPVGQGCILLVEDEAAVRDAARRILLSRGYTVLEAENGADALRRYGEDPDDIDLIVTDLIMPEMGGCDLVRRLRAQRAGFPAIFISGYSADRIEADNKAAGTVVQKPFTSAALLNAVHEALCDAMLEPLSRAESVQNKNGHFDGEAPVLVVESS